MRTIKFYAFALLLLSSFNSISAKEYRLQSPSGKIAANIDCGDNLSFSVCCNGKEVLAKSPVSMTLSDGTVWGEKAKTTKVVRKSNKSIIESPFSPSATMPDVYNSLTLRMKGGWSVEFRAYDDGFAYRFASTLDKPYEIATEQTDFNFPADYTASVPYVRTGSDDNMQSQFFNSFENLYTVERLSALNPRRLAFLPLSVDTDGVTVAITETDLNDYPGLYLYNPDGTNSLKGKHAPYPTKIVDGGYNNIEGVVTETADYIARVDGPRTFPWRILVIGDDKVVASSNLSYLLAEPSRIADTSWIKPGKVAWDWWNAWNLTGVDFKTGVNNETYKYYIDFASGHGIEYVILDDGWSETGAADLMKVVPEIDLEELVAYAAERNVGIILWAGYWAFDRDMENVCRHYSEMGIKGFKIDFFDSDDHRMVKDMYKIAERAADYHFILSYHGMKANGMQRTYPNILSFEGVKGLENYRWISRHDVPDYECTLPFMRMQAGPMDYTPGGMRNVNRSCFSPVNDQPRVYGTRAHQVALYTLFESPLQMLSDSPTTYMEEDETLAFLKQIPTVFDETVVLDAEVGNHIIVAKRKGDVWYIGGITDWDARSIDINLNFLPEGNYRAQIFSDGINADFDATDYIYTEQDVQSSDRLQIHMQPGGGWAAILRP